MCTSNHAIKRVCEAHKLWYFFKEDSSFVLGNNATNAFYLSCHTLIAYCRYNVKAELIDTELVITVMYCILKFLHCGIHSSTEAKPPQGAPYKGFIGILSPYARSFRAKALRAFSVN